MEKKKTRGVTLIECLIAMTISSGMILGTLSLMGLARMQNELEQERVRAHQIVCQALEIERYKLFTWTESQSQQTIWDNGTPEDTMDDTVGTIEVIVRDPKTNTVLTQAPQPATLMEIEATITWIHRSPRLEGKSMRETVITFKAP